MSKNKNMEMEMDNDDLPIGRIHSRREILALFGVSGAALVVGSLAVRAATSGGTDAAAVVAPQASSTVSASTICIATPELTEGPYFVDELLYRSDVRTDPSDGTTSAGVPLTLAFNLSSISGTACTPLAGATVDIWHCDALGRYSDERANNTVGKKFLRGTQVTDASGMAQFTTIYPGWYQGRAVHIHFKVRTDPLATTGTQLTSQLFFDDALSDQIFTQAPYAGRGTRDTRNSRDGIYASGGDQLLLPLTQNGDGYTTAFNVGMTMP